MNWWHLVDDAIEEDLGSIGDISGGCLDADLVVEWYIEAQADGVVSGIGIAEYLLGASLQAVSLMELAGEPAPKAESRVGNQGHPPGEA